MKEIRLFVLALYFIFGINAVSAQGFLMFSKKNIEFGIVDKSEPLRAIFSFKNTGNAPVEISDVMLSTGAIRVYYPKGLIQPNETGNVMVVYNIQDAYPMRFKKSVFIQTSNQTEKIRLQLSGEISEIPPAKQRRNDGLIWYRIYKDGKYGALNSNEKRLLEPKYSTLYYEHGNFIAKEGSMTYLFSEEGKRLLELECNDFNLVNGEYKAEDANKHIAIFDKSGKCIIPFEREYISVEQIENSKGYYANTTNYWSLCSDSGKEVFRFDKSFYFYYKKDRFVVIVKSDSHTGSDDTVWSFYDITGKKIGSVEGNKELSIWVNDKGEIIATDIGKMLFMLADDNNYKNGKYVGSKDYEKVLGTIMNMTQVIKNPLDE